MLSPDRNKRKIVQDQDYLLINIKIKCEIEIKWDFNRVHCFIDVSTFCSTLRASSSTKYIYNDTIN